MRLTEAHLSAIAGRPANVNMRSVVAALAQAGVGTGLNRSHRLAHFLAQLAHESMGWHYDREVWGPSAAQKRYEGRADLGNTQPGDGYRFRGRGPIQITGRSNYRQFTIWAQRMVADAPDFVANPDALNRDPWEGLSAIWYWDTRGLNALADANDARGVTKRINGGFNGLDDRLRYYDRAALVLLGYGLGDLTTFQRMAGIPADGKSGPATRAAMHRALSAAPLVQFGAPPPVPKPPPVMPRPLSPAPAAPPSNAIGWGFTILAVVIAAAMILGAK